MSGFYVNHLKSERAKYFAVEIEKRIIGKEERRTPIKSISFKAVNENDLDHVLSAGYAVLRDHPEIFYYGGDMEANITGMKVTLKLNLLYTADEIYRLRGILEQKIADILKTIPRGASLWEKERRIFEYLQMETTYVDDDHFERYNIVGCLVRKVAVCEGISKAFAVLCHRVGIPCIVVCSKTHMWNIVNINGKACNVDATYATDSPHSFCDYTYFNVADSELHCTEHEKEINCMPVCVDKTNSYYAKMNLQFDSENEMKRYVAKALFARKTPIYVKLSSGNIEKAVNSMSFFLPYNISFSYNGKTRTALITPA